LKPLVLKNTIKIVIL